jgi:hypothetical protein
MSFGDRIPATMKTSQFIKNLSSGDQDKKTQSL